MTHWIDRQIDEMLRAPWWGNAIVAAALALLSGVGIPWLEPYFSGMEPFFGLLVVICWVFAFIFFSGAVVTVLVARRRGELFSADVSIGDLKLLPWLQFEDFVAELFRRRGYQVQQVGGTGPDGGIDLTVSKNGQTTIVQCKHSRFRKMGVKVVRETLGVLVIEGADSGIIIATEGFTGEAWKLAKRTDHIKLVTGTDLLRVVKKVKADEAEMGTEKIPIGEQLTAMISDAPAVR